VLLLFRVWFILELSRSVWWILDFLAWTGLTGELHRLTSVGAFCGSSQILPAGTGLTGAAHQPDRCSPVVLELLVSLRSRVGVGGCSFLGPVALQRLRGLVQLG
jgi:hypothetical protein